MCRQAALLVRVLLLNALSALIPTNYVILPRYMKMTRNILSLLTTAVVFLLAAPLQAQVASSYANAAQSALDRADAKVETGLSTMENLDVLDHCWSEVDRYLNQAYREALSALQRRSPQLAEKLKADQRAWLQFIAVYCTAVSDGFGEGGTMHRVVGLRVKVEFWIQRIRYLERVSALSEDLFTES